MASARNVPAACASLKAGKWERSKLVGIELKGKTLGVIGLGKVGLNVAQMARGLGMRIVAVDPYASQEIADANNVSLVLNLKDVLTTCDFLTIHTPLIASTKGMISSEELDLMKKGARILNVARGGMIDEAALLAALESGQIGGAGLDVFAAEPPTEGSMSAKLIAHPAVVATPHLGASTVEAQENVARDVCEQVVEVLSGGLPRAAVNAPIILPEEYRKLQPFVKLVEKMGQLYTEYYKSTRQSFDLVYEGEIANLTNTKPLYASLVKGLTAGISANTNVNIVNATLVAKERGIVINEQHSRDPITHTYSSLVTLRARPARSSSQDRNPIAPGEEHVIAGFCSDSQAFISRLDRFSTSFAPEGTLLICHNYDSPGKIGVVGSLLGKAGVNVNSMTVAPLQIDRDSPRELKRDGNLKNEALMILGLDREVEADTLKQLSKEEGILDVSIVSL
jgi:D-3-phosphoglycerate dehydrogenase